MTECAGTPDGVQSTSRLAAIARLGLDRRTTDPVLQQLVEEAAERLELPIGLVSIVLDSAQVFAAQCGLGGWIAEANGTPVEWSFCANSVQSGQEFVVQDAATHPLVRDNPVVTMEGIRCYAGIPLVVSGGEVVGNLCVLGSEARTFSEADLQILRGLAARAVERIESREH
ncbi:MAG TPA: GAF domain-containing protein [Longimicrobium sp.]|jgi:GAF domain-containing protein|uniref:GAF domain-containing protein n=1 Tax=Longimicrobium sp. TaxID=2029185 RepID=UPI002ED8E27D